MFILTSKSILVKKIYELNPLIINLIINAQIVFNFKYNFVKIVNSFINFDKV